MIATLIGVQTICVGVTAYMAMKTTKKTVKLKLMNNEKGYKYYKVGGF